VISEIERSLQLVVVRERVMKHKELVLISQRIMDEGGSKGSGGRPLFIVPSLSHTL
jgi:hypothetical protein